MAEDLKAYLKKYSEDAYLQIGLLVALLLLYVLTKTSIFGVLFAIALIGTVAVEIWMGSKKRGWKEELKDTVISLVGIVVLWFALTIILNSPVPINAVVSCSMLPNVERGDLIIVQGADPVGYEVELSSEELSALQASEVTIYFKDGSSFKLNGSIYSYCAQNRNEVCNSFINSPEDFSEQRGPLTFHYGACTRQKGEIGLVTPCVESVDFGSTRYLTNISHDTIVYTPPKGDLYSYTGDIIHRLYFKIHSGGETYYLTKGDNNPVFDIQVYDYSVNLGNTAPSSKDYKGKIFFKIPVLGYPKLFISGFFSETAQCDSNLIYPLAG